MEKEQPKEEVKEEADDVVSKAEKAAQRLEEANKKTEELIKRQEAMMARSALGGKADAGQEPEKPKEETPAEYAKRVTSGKVETQ